MAACLRVAVENREYERAVSLAEKYCDFSTLIEICELLNNEERLWRYMDQFRDSVRFKQLNWLILRIHGTVSVMLLSLQSNYKSSPSLSYGYRTAPSSCWPSNWAGWLCCSSSSKLLSSTPLFSITQTESHSWLNTHFVFHGGEKTGLTWTVRHWCTARTRGCKLQYFSR